MEQKELNEIIERHQHWINRDCEGWESMKADLGGADLRKLSFYGANLSEADLRGADLEGADLSNANLDGAVLHRADFSYADLYRASLIGVHARAARFKEAGLHNTNFSYAYLRQADFYDADLYCVRFVGADIYGANFYMARLEYNDFSDVVNPPPIICPDTGSFIGWKQVARLIHANNGDNLYLTAIAKLRIPEDAKRSSSLGRKCRCDKAVVLEIQELDGTVLDIEAESRFDPKFVYRAGETVSVSNFCEDRFEECAPGIHFFVTRQEAVDY